MYNQSGSRTMSLVSRRSLLAFCSDVNIAHEGATAAQSKIFDLIGLIHQGRLWRRGARSHPRWLRCGRLAPAGCTEMLMSGKDADATFCLQAGGEKSKDDRTGLASVRSFFLYCLFGEKQTVQAWQHWHHYSCPTFWSPFAKFPLHHHRFLVLF